MITKTKSGKSYWFFCSKGLSKTISFEECLLLFLEEHGYNKERILKELQVNKTENPMEIIFGIQPRENKSYETFLQDCKNYLQDLNPECVYSENCFLMTATGKETDSQGVVNFIVKYLMCK